MQVIAQLYIFFKEDPTFQFCSNAEFSLESDAILHGSGQAENQRPEKTTELASFGCFSSVFRMIYFFHLTCFLFHFEGRLLIQSDELLPCKLCCALQTLRPSCLYTYFHPGSLMVSAWPFI